MFKRFLVTGALALTAAVAVGAQSSTEPQQNPTQPQPKTQPGMQAQGPTQTLVGCVYRESDVPGRTPNVAERAGIMEDYILADAEAKESPGSSSTSGATGTSGAAGHKMYKLEQIADERLSAHVGKRVEVTGRIDAEAPDRPTGTGGAQPDENMGSPDEIELPEFEVTSIREIEGTCPPQPSR